MHILMSRFRFRAESGKHEATDHFSTVTRLPVWINSVGESPEVQMADAED